MAEAAICFASADKEFAEQLASYLSAHASLGCELAGSRQDNDFLDLVEQCLPATFAIVILSRQSVGTGWPRVQWERVLPARTAEPDTHVAYVLKEACPYPALLRRRDFFDCSQDLQSGFRLGRRWVVKCLHPDRTAPRVAIAAEADHSLDWLVDKPGLAQTSSSAAAAWFATQHWLDFEGAYIVNCRARTRTGVWGELGELMGLRLAGTTEQNRLAVMERAAGHRALYVFEGLSDDMHEIAELGGRSSVIVVPGTGAEPATLAKVRDLFAARALDQAACLHAVNSLMLGVHSSGDWAELYSIGLRALRILKERLRLAEAHELLEWLAGEAEQYGDESALRDIQWEAGWIIEEWNFSRSGRPEMKTVSATQLTLFS